MRAGYARDIYFQRRERFVDVGPVIVKVRFGSRQGLSTIFKLNRDSNRDLRGMHSLAPCRSHHLL